MGSDTKVVEDSSLVYTVLFVCVLAVLAFLIYKLYIKVNELTEKVESLTEPPPSSNGVVSPKEDTPKLEEVPPVNPGPSKTLESIKEN
jgi:hypothetical protein|tara:strand:- start:5749 stop:6012 length:264 start_codon:yes stop_codon:yes gene_type:complete